MIKAIISNKSILYINDFSINIIIDKPIINLSIEDFIIQFISGTHISIPSELEIKYAANSPKTLCMIPVELPDNSEGSFKIYMRTKLYTIDNRKIGISEDAVGVPNTEEQHIICEEKIFEYDTTED